MIFPNPPPRRTLLARLLGWRASRRADRDATTIGVERHHRMIRASQAAANHAGRMGMARNGAGCVTD